MTTDNPIVTIQRKQNWYWAALFLSIAITAYAIFGALIPVLSSGDFNAVWPSDRRTGRSACIFFSSLIWVISLPSMFRCLNVGDIHFFDNRLEVHTFIIPHQRIYYYKNILVNQHGSHRVTIHQRNLPGWKHPLKQLKTLYFDGTTFGLSPRGYINPDKVTIALNILKSSAEFNQKGLS